MIEELYINNVLVDIQSVDIVRKYISPYFQDVNALMNDSTYTIKLPLTQKNLVTFGYMNREDMFTSIPYDFLRADYYANGLPVIINGQVMVLEVSSTIDIQITYGVSRNVYSPLFKRKLNEIPIGGAITADDWVVNWNRNTMFASGKKYRYLDYVSGERESDLVSSDEVIDVPNPWYGHEKEMTQHPYVSYANILDLIITDHNIQNPSNTIATDTLEAIKAGVSNKGLILGGNKSDFTFTDIATYESPDAFDENAKLRITDELIYRSGFITYQPSISLAGSTISLNGSIFNIDKYPIRLNIDLKLSENTLLLQPELHIYKVKRDGTGTEKIGEIEYSIVEIGVSLFKTVVEIKAERPYLYYLKVVIKDGTNDSFVYVTDAGTLSIEMNITEAIYSILHPDNESEQIGHYDCLKNLPDMTAMEFIQEMMIISGHGVSYDENGKMIFVSLESLNLSQAYDWTGKISLIQYGAFRFNDMAQRNRIAFSNSKNLNYTAEAFIDVSDLTLQEKKDLYTIRFDLPDRNPNGLAEFILYKQRVTQQGSETSFSNEYSEKPSVMVQERAGLAVIEYANPADYTPPWLPMNVICTKQSDKVLDISDYYDPDIILPEAGNRIISVDGVNVSNAFVVSRDAALVTTNINLITDNDEHLIVFDNFATGFVNQKYIKFKKLTNRPIIKDVEINLDFFTTAAIDIKKPVYIGEWGKYCIVLELNAPNKEVATAKLLLINQTL